MQADPTSTRKGGARVGVPHREAGTGSMSRWVDKTGRVVFRGCVTVQGVKHNAKSASVMGGRSEAATRHLAERHLRDLLRRLAEGPPPALMPDGRAHVRLSDPTFRMWIYARDNGTCRLCDHPVAFDAFHVDHVRPRIEGGTDHVGNLRITHPQCNVRRVGERRRAVRF